MRVHIFKLLVSHYLCFILWLVESRRFANRCRHCWCGNALLVPFGAILLHIMTNGHLFVVIIMSSRSLPAVLQQWTLSSPFGWFDTSQVIVKFKTPKQGSCWGVDVLVCEDSGYSLKYGCEGDTRLWRRSFSTSTYSRVARFDDIFDFGFRMYLVSISCLCLSLVLSINSPNATTLHSRCIWEGVLRVL